MTSSRIERRTVFFRGLVQGVGFRYTTRRIARRYDVAGYVQNLDDGRVRLVSEGRGEELDRFLGELEGAMSGYISDTAAEIAPATGEFDGFGIRH